VYEQALIQTKRLLKAKQHPMTFRSVGHVQNWNPTASYRLHTRRVEHQEHDRLRLNKTYKARRRSTNEVDSKRVNWCCMDRGEDERFFFHLKLHRCGSSCRLLQAERNKRGNEVSDVQTSHVEQCAEKLEFTRGGLKGTSQPKVVATKLLLPIFFESMQMTSKAVASNATQPVA
jgi:hypothetical protein